MNRRDKMKKIVIFTLILLFTLSFVKVSFADNTVNVSLSDNYIGHSTTYDIAMFANCDVGKGDTISVTFDDSIPIFRNTYKINDIKVNNATVSETPKLFGHRIDIISPVDVEKDRKMEIVIPQGILQNPSSPGYFTLTVKTGENTYESNYYHITDKSTVKDVEFSETSDGVEIDFRTGFNGNLQRYEMQTVSVKGFTFSRPIPKDFIFIRFSHTVSEGFVSVSKHDITVNGTNPPLNPDVKTHFEDTDREEKEIAICIPKDINANSNVKIFIKGISIQDNETGILYAKVWTSKELTPVKSNDIIVKGEYFIKTSCSVMPDAPDGENGFYKTSPKATLSVDKGSAMGKVETFYSFGGKNFTPYSAPLKIKDGSKILYYYSVGYAEKRKVTEDIQNIGFLIDSIPPEISVESPLSSDTPIYDLNISFADENFDYAVITVYGINFTITDKSIDLPIYLFDKITPFTVKAFDKAGNISRYNGNILLKE